MRRTSYAPTRARAPPRARVYAKPRPVLEVATPPVTVAAPPVLEVATPQSTQLFVEERADAEIPVQLEEEVPQGTVYQRREFHNEETPRRHPSSPTPLSLHDCIRNGVLHMDKAADLILGKMRHEEFNEAVYYEFVRSDVAIRASTTYGKLNRASGRDIELLWGIANRMTAEIGRAASSKQFRSIENVERTTPACTDVTVCLKNTIKIWKTRADPPFIQVNLNQICDDWVARKRDNVYQRLSAIYRLILQQLTNPPQMIKEYALRLHKTTGKSDTLKNLPEHLECILKDFGEDLLGYGHEELRQERRSVEDSEFYQGLGENDAERREQFEDLKDQRLDWRPQLFKCIQTALRDIRSYGYEAGKGWIANNRQSKRAAPIDENANPDTEREKRLRL